EQRVAIRGCPHHHFGADVAAGTWPVFDDKLLTEPLRQPLTDQACRDVECTGRSKRDNDVHRPRRISLRPRDARDGRQRGSACGQMQKISAGKFHFEPPSRSGHSTTSSARASRVGGTSRPSDFAVLRLMTSSIFVGCSTGSSAGCAPFKILST